MRRRRHQATAYVLLHHCFGEVNGKIGHWGHAKGGMGAITKAMAQSAVASGAVIRTNAAVERVLVEGERANGVVLETGETIKARAVAANVGPKLLFRDLVAEADLDATIRAPFLAIKTGSGSFRMNVALAELPDFICRPGKEIGPQHRSGIVIGPTMDYLERAYLDARAQRLVARADRRNDDLVDARPVACALRQARRKPFRAARGAPSSQRAKLVRHP